LNLIEYLKIIERIKDNRTVEDNKTVSKISNFIEKILDLFVNL